MYYNLFMNEINNSFLEIKKSKFYGFLYNVGSTEDVEIILNKLSFLYQKV